MTMQICQSSKIGWWLYSATVARVTPTRCPFAIRASTFELAFVMVRRLEPELKKPAYG
jgi:hypothetical protein